MSVRGSTLKSLRHHGLPQLDPSVSQGSGWPPSPPPLTSASPQFLCTVVAILLHHTYMGTFAWTLVEGLHVYRMLTEVRNIDAGPMRFYYVVGWGIPAIVTGEDPEQLCSPSVVQEVDSRTQGEPAALSPS